MKLPVEDNQGKPAGSVIYPWEEMEKSLLEKLKRPDGSEAKLADAEKGKSEAEASLAQSQATIKALEAKNAALEEQVAKFGDVETRKAWLGEWANNITKEDWELLGKTRGYLVEAAPLKEEVPAKPLTIVDLFLLAGEKS